MNSHIQEVSYLISLSKNKSDPFETRLRILERAHLVSQPYAAPHFLVHWEMFKLAFISLQWRELLGQIPRLLLAMPGSWLGKAPKGNVGSTKMGIFEEKK
jgi:hypothetical protein